MTAKPLLTTFSFKEHYRGNLTWLPERTIFLTRHGSQAYGTNTPTSDLDVKGIAIPPKEYFLGYSHVFEQAEVKGDPDVVIYDLRKFMKLAADCNPNIIEVLHTDPSDWLLTTPLFEELYEHRKDFLSKKAKYTFSGYAISQLKRIRTHKRWLLNPPSHKPERQEYGLSIDHKAASTSEIGAFDALIAEGHQFDEHAMKLLQREKEYQNALTEWQQYENWKTTRNHKRSELEAKFGYDCKHACHLVRLMRMCREILTTGEVLVKRPDAAELLAIRNGAWSYDRLIDWADQQEAELAVLYETTTMLPRGPDMNKLDALCVRLVEKSLR